VGADNQNFNTLADKSFYVRLFFCRITLAEQNVCAEAGSFQGIQEPGLVLNPAGLILGRQYNTNLGFASFTLATCEYTADNGYREQCNEQTTY
jgi:hypothetical protein